MAEERVLNAGRDNDTGEDRQANWAMRGRDSEWRINPSASAISH